jgi:serine/threonine protein kinase
VLVDTSLNAKLTDFGMSRSVKLDCDENSMTAVGTPAWTAPEIITSEGDYDEKVDVVSTIVVTFRAALVDWLDVLSCL